MLWTLASSEAPLSASHPAAADTAQLERALGEYRKRCATSNWVTSLIRDVIRTH